MGVVYRARYVGNDRIVAIKLLPEEVAKNPTLVARFDRELEILTQLRHPNIVHCFGGTTESKQRFYAMELVDGGTLAEALAAKGRLSWDHVVEYGIQMCAALQYAHDRGVIHRDVKPANFLLSKSGKLKLSDFGLASIVAAQRITTAGKTAGTFLYMAPEQIRGKPPLSPRTDLYALGCVLFELLVGKPPFEGDSPATVLHKHLKEIPPRVGPLLLDCPSRLDQLVADLLQKDPELRPASAAIVEQRLVSILRPSLSHIDPFARTPSESIPQVTAAPSSEEDEVAVSESRPLISPRDQWKSRAWTIGLLFLALWGWWSAFSASRQSHLFGSAWVAAAQSPGAGQLPAIQKLGELSTLPRGAAEVLMTLAETDSRPEYRVAALATLARHREASQQYATRLISLEREEADPNVRSQAGQTRQQLQATGGKSSGWFWSLMTVGLFGFIILGSVYLMREWLESAWANVSEALRSRS